MLNEMDLEGWERRDLEEARSIIVDGCKSSFSLEPMQMDPLKFASMSTLGKIRFLQQAINFVNKGIYIGGWPYLKRTWEGNTLNFIPVFDVHREDKPLDPRIINDGSYTQPPEAFLSRNIVTENCFCRLIWLQDVLHMADIHRFCFKADLEKAFHQVFRAREQWHQNAIFVPDGPKNSGKG